MESFGNSFDEEWNNLSRMFVDNEDADQLAKQEFTSSQYDLDLNFKIPNIFFLTGDESNNVNSFVVDDESIVYASDDTNSSFYHLFSQETSNCSSGASNSALSLPYPCHESFQFCHSNIHPSQSNNVHDQSFDFCATNEINHSSTPTQVFSDESVYLTQNIMEKAKIDNSFVQGNGDSSLKRKVHEPLNVGNGEVNIEKFDKSPKKRARVSRDNKNKKIKQLTKNQDLNGKEESNDNINGERNGQSSSSCSSKDDLNGSQDLNGVPNSNGKTRASRGAATDPQSLYARKRRERINERLRILQNLVPNGTKVDISTMLEEAVEYVKFLKLQIKLLSSDDMWMFAPIAYNGMNMGLYQNITPNL